jgi:hypothetical protein
VNGAERVSGAGRPEAGEPAVTGGVVLPAGRRRWLLVAAAVIALLAVVVAVVLTRGGTGADQANTPKPPAGSGVAAPPPRTSQSAVPSSPAAAPSSAPPSATAAAPALPAGWYLYSDQTGFSVAAPDGWAVSREGTILYFRDPSGGRIFSVDQTNRPQNDPVADWTRQEGERAASYYPGYQRIRIEPVQYFVACADWEFTYDQRGTRAHVINRGVVTSDHQAYGIWWSTPDAAWQENRQYFDLIMSTFKPKP